MATRPAAALALAFFVTVISGTARAADSDTIPDASDNCKNLTNQSQLDTNLDGYGNACDADYDNNGVVGTYLSADYWILNNAFNSHPGDANWNPDVDCNEDGVINSYESATCWGPKIGQAPGASGLSCAGTIPCSDTDRDGLHDGADNCLEKENPDQTDTNIDGYGNACDADYDNDGVVGTYLSADYWILNNAFNSHPGDANWNPDVDCNGDNVINSYESATCWGPKIGQAPGASGLSCAGTFPCPCNKDFDAFCPCQSVSALPGCIGSPLAGYLGGQEADCTYAPSQSLGLTLHPTWSCTPSTPAPNVVVDVSHATTYRIVDPGAADFPFPDTPGTKLWPFARLLAADGMVVFEAGPPDYVNAPLTGATGPLQKINPDVLVIVGATGTFTTAEVTAIHDWVALGHGLLITGDTHGAHTTDAIWKSFIPQIQIGLAPGISTPPFGSIPGPYRWEWDNPPDSGQGAVNGSTEILCPSAASCPHLVHSFIGGPLCPVVDTSGECTDQHATTLSPMVKLDPLLTYPPREPPTNYDGYMHSFAFCYGTGPKPGRVYISQEARMLTRQQTNAYDYGFQVPNSQTPHQGQVNENELYVLNVMRWLSGVGTCPGS